MSPSWIYLQLVLELARLDAKDLLGRPAILFELHLQRVHDRLLFAQELFVVLKLCGLETLQLLGRVTDTRAEKQGNDGVLFLE